MDFLDPDKVRRHNLMVLIGHCLVGIAIAMASLVLLYQSYGYGINKEGEVIQNGLVFTGSNPNGASIFLNSNDSGFRTDKRLVLAAGNYVIQFNKDGYWPWTRSIQVAGSRVSRYDYAFLFPRQLTTTKVKQYNAAPLLSTQSPDRRWLLAQLPGSGVSFDEYDLKNPTVAPVKLTLPADIITTSSGSKWSVVEWSNDNRHLLLRHAFGKSSEFILVDRSDPASSLNLNATLAVRPTEIHLVNKRYDRYYIFNRSAQTLQTANLGDTTLRSYLKNVLAYKSYGDRTMLYVTDDIKETTATKGEVAAKLTDGNRTNTIRQMQAGKTYLLELATYAGDQYVLAGSSSEDKVNVYKNPVDQINNPSIGVAVQITTLKVPSPTYVAFSDSARYVMAEGGSHFSVYDALQDTTYTYGFDNPLDKPQKHAEWMDDSRILYVSEGRVFVFDYDQTNRHTLMVDSPAYLPAFTPDFKRLFTLAPNTNKKLVLGSTWMLIPADR
jgi:hypothetical protein